MFDYFWQILYFCLYVLMKKVTLLLISLKKWSFFLYLWVISWLILLLYKILNIVHFSFHLWMGKWLYIRSAFGDQREFIFLIHPLLFETLSNELYVINLLKYPFSLSILFFWLILLIWETAPFSALLTPSLILMYL